MTDLPALNQQVVVGAQDGVEHPSRVEDVDATTLTLARPLDLPAEVALGVGSALEVRWTAPSGLYRLPVQVSAQRSDGPLRLWVTEPTGHAVRVQRRAHVRVEAHVPMTIGLPGDTLQAVLLDVSEAAVRVRAEAVRGQDPLVMADVPPGQEVTVAFRFGGTDFDLPATVLKLNAGSEYEPVPASTEPSAEAAAEARGGTVPEADAVEGVLLLGIGEQQASALRRTVLAEQIRLRNLMRD